MRKTISVDQSIQIEHTTL